MDLPSTMRSSAVLNQEYLLQGSIVDAHRDLLLHRLTALCDSVDTGTEKFHDHEIVYSLKATPAVPAVILRVRHALDRPEEPWHIRYVGQADAGDRSRHTLLRSCIDIGVSENVQQFLSQMGFGIDFEYVVKGYLFRKGRLKVTVSKILKVQTPGNTESADQPFTGSYLVELSVVATYGQDQIQEDMKNFAEQLKPLVLLEKIDHRRISQ
jgi:mediator of RNA polymerase II transcription subunit 18